MNDDQAREFAAACLAASDMVTPLRWHKLAIYGTPCSARSVLCADGMSWFAGWWDADDCSWRDCTTGGTVDGVTHWAEPIGPWVESDSNAAAEPARPAERTP